MIIVTTPDIPGKRIVKVLGIARGSTIRARNLGRDIMAILKMLIGGEIKTYTEMMARAREESIARMETVAREMGANAIVNVRLTSVTVLSSTAEILAYGTAVVIDG
ncbi:MAG: YbjQ family protein [FCB group bacterium]|nr:YbjQ family protein [FCB group bacterium]